MGLIYSTINCGNFTADNINLNNIIIFNLKFIFIENFKSELIFSNFFQKTIFLNHSPKLDILEKISQARELKGGLKNEKYIRSINFRSFAFDKHKCN
jgi:hypothetical protein